MKENRILLVEDDEKSLQLLKEVLTSNGYAVTTAVNGREGLDEFNRNPCHVVITDLQMPIMDGNELIDHLQKTEAPPLIFVETVHKDPAMIIDIMKKGVFDYLIKPLDLNDLLIKVKRAFETYEMKRTIEIMEKERLIRLENQLEWYKWEDRALSRDKTNVNTSLFQSLQTNFNQGAGFGALIELIKLIISSATKEGENYLIDAELFSIVNENAKMAEKALQTFSDIGQLISSELNFEDMSYDEFYQFIRSIIDDTENFSQIKEQVVTISDKKARADITLRINKDNLRKAFTEILLNAHKFSEKNTTIIIIVEAKNDIVTVTTINKPEVDEKERVGIPMEYENIVFEPFFRLTKKVEEDYKTLNFGLGLTLAEKIISKHGGKASISNINDYTDLKKGPVTKVNFTFSIPVGK